MADVVAERRARRDPGAGWREIARHARRHWLGLAAFGLIVALLVMSIGAPWLAPFDPTATNYQTLLQPPSAGHWFGTDTFGRDVLSRVIHGGRSALVIGILSALIGATAGAAIGILSAYFGGLTDLLVQRLVDILLCLPIVVLSLVMVAVLGRHEILGIDVNLILAIAIPIVPKVARVIRAAALSVSRLAYVDAARAAGFSHWRIMLRHIAPNVAAPWIILVTTFVSQAILIEASLSFLGLGVTEPTPSWGLMLSGSAADHYLDAPWIIIFPGLAIATTVFAFNLFGDALRDALDPKLRT